MIYVRDISTPARLRMVRTLAATPDDPVLELTGTVSRTRHVVPVSDVEAGALYIDLTADLSAIQDHGEYEYILYQGETVLARGIMRIGHAPASRPVQYVKHISYEQY